MEIRVYYKKEKVKKALERAHVDEGMQGEKFDRIFGWGGFTKDKEFPELVYHSLNSTVNTSPSVVKDLEPVEVSLHDLLPPHKNPHIKQGSGQDEQNRFEVTHTTRREYGGEQYGHRQFPTISIWIKGTDLQQVLSCYDKIRKGELGGSWEPPTPQLEQEKKES